MSVINEIRRSVPGAPRPLSMIAERVLPECRTHSAHEYHTMLD
jgi:hypothetical protein